VRITVHRRLADDLRVVRTHYLKEGGAKLRDLFNAEFDQMLQTIAENPKRFHYVSGELRRANFPNFPFHLYRETAEELRVLVLRHHRREPRYGLKRT
jgi:hypothetical protein